MRQAAQSSGQAAKLVIHKSLNEFDDIDDEATTHHSSRFVCPSHPNKKVHPRSHRPSTSSPATPMCGSAPNAQSLWPSVNPSSTNKVHNCLCRVPQNHWNRQVQGDHQDSQAGYTRKIARSQRVEWEIGGWVPSGDFGNQRPIRYHYADHKS